VAVEGKKKAKKGGGVRDDANGRPDRSVDRLIDRLTDPFDRESVFDVPALHKPFKRLGRLVEREDRVENRLDGFCVRACVCVCVCVRTCVCACV